jgi:hypothetical protein
MPRPVNLDNYTLKQQRRMAQGKCHLCDRPLAPSCATVCRHHIAQQRTNRGTLAYRRKIAPACGKVYWDWFNGPMAATG